MARAEVENVFGDTMKVGIELEYIVIHVYTGKVGIFTSMWKDREKNNFIFFASYFPQKG